MSPDTKKMTPLLVASEDKTMGERLAEPIGLMVALIVALILYSVFVTEGVVNVTIAWIVVIIVVPLLYFLFGGKKHIAIYEEGILIKAGLRSSLYKWDSLQNFTADKTKGRFTIKRKGLGSIMVNTRDHYAEVEKILLERISPGQ